MKQTTSSQGAAGEGGLGQHEDIVAVFDIVSQGPSGVHRARHVARSSPHRCRSDAGCAPAGPCRSASVVVAVSHRRAHPLVVLAPLGLQPPQRRRGEAVGPSPADQCRLDGQDGIYRYSHGSAVATRALRRTCGGTKAELNFTAVRSGLSGSMAGSVGLKPDLQRVLSSGAL